MSGVLIHWDFLRNLMKYIRTLCQNMKGEALIYGVPVGLSATQIQVSEMPQDKNQETRDVGSQNELLGSGS